MTDPKICTAGELLKFRDEQERLKTKVKCFAKKERNTKDRTIPKEINSQV
jgi:hypothetical protein